MAEAPTRPQPELVTAEGPSGGPVYRYRGAEIRCAKGDHVCGLFMWDRRIAYATGTAWQKLFVPTSERRTTGLILTYGIWWRGGPEPCEVSAFMSGASEASGRLGCDAFRGEEGRDLIGRLVADASRPAAAARRN